MAPKRFGASGTLVQSASDIPIKKAILRLTPETLQKRNSSNGRFRIAIENLDESQWLNLALSGSDPDSAVRFTFSRTRFDIPPRGLAWGWIDVSAPRPERGKEVSREIEIIATDNNETVSTQGKFIHSSIDWVRYVRYALTVLGGIVAIVGTFLPWTVAQQDYYLIDLPLITNADIVAKTEPSVRLAAIVLAVAMVIGIVGKTGKADHRVVGGHCGRAYRILDLFDYQGGDGRPHVRRSHCRDRSDRRPYRRVVSQAVENISYRPPVRTSLDPFAGSRRPSLRYSCWIAATTWESSISESEPAAR